VITRHQGGATHMNSRNQLRFGRVRFTPTALGDKLRERRQAQGMSLRDVAEKSGVASSTIHSVEQGNYHVQLDRFLLILAALDLVPSEVLIEDRAENHPPPTPKERAVAELISSETDTPTLLRKLADILDM